MGLSDERLLKRFGRYHIGYARSDIQFQVLRCPENLALYSKFARRDSKSLRSKSTGRRWSEPVGHAHQCRWLPMGSRSIRLAQ